MQTDSARGNVCALRGAAAFAVVVLVLAGSAAGDYVNPPGWDNDAYFTHQSWDFTGCISPLAPDGDLSNPYGSGPPTATILNGVWVPGLDDGSGRQGMWEFAYPLAAEDGAVFEIPNQANPNMTKEIWFQLTFKALTADPYDLLARTVQDVRDNNGKAGTLVWDDAAMLSAGVDGVWVRYTAVWELAPQPASETIHIGATLMPGETVWLDQVAIDTHCVPEPGMLTMLALGGAMLLKKR